MLREPRATTSPRSTPPPNLEGRTTGMSDTARLNYKNKDYVQFHMRRDGRLGSGASDCGFRGEHKVRCHIAFAPSKGHRLSSRCCFYDGTG